MPSLNDLFPEYKPPRENIVIDADFENVDPVTKEYATGLLDYAHKTYGYNAPITSGYRDPQRNANAGGAPNSWHIQGKAVDLDLSGLTPEQLADVEAKAREKFSEVLYHDAGSGMHLHAANPIQQPSFMDNVAGLFKPAVAEASPAPVNPNSLDALFADNKPQPTVQPVQQNSLDALFATPTTTNNAQSTLPATSAPVISLIDETDNYDMNTGDNKFKDVINQYVMQPATNAIGTVLEYADKPRGAIAGTIVALQDGKSPIEGAVTGWKENTSFKDTLPTNLTDSALGKAVGTAGKVLLNPVGLSTPVTSYFNSLPEADKEKVAKTAVGLGLDIALDPAWIVTPAKAVAATKALGKFVGAEKVTAPIVNALEKAKNSEQVQSILNKEFELPGWGNITVKRALSEKGPIDDLLDKLKIDKAKLNEQVAEAGKVLEPLTVPQKENVTRMIEASPEINTAVKPVLPKAEMDEFFELVAKDDKIPVQDVLKRYVDEWSGIIKDTVTEFRKGEKKGSSGVYYNDITGRYDRVIKSVNEHPAVQAFVTKEGRMPKSNEWYSLAEDYVLRNVPEYNDKKLLAQDAQDYLTRLDKFSKQQNEQQALFPSDTISATTKPQLIEKMAAEGFSPEQIKQVETVADSLSKFGIGRSDELLKRNIISQETYDKYYGRYIRREYLKNENPLEFAKQLRETGNVAEAEKIEKAAESIANNRFKKSGVKMNWDDIKQRQNLSEAEQEALGRIMDASHPFAKGGQVSSDLIAKYDFLEGVKNQFGSATEQAGYRLLEGKGYGPLSGTWVPKEVYNEVTKTVRSFSEPETMWRQAVSWWKMGKTILNPAGHARNFMSNAILLDIGGVPTAKVPVYLTRAAKEMLEKGKYYQEVKNNTTILLDTFKQAEALQLNKPGVVKSVIDKAGDIYQKNEEMGKLAAYMYARETGKDIAQAAKFANDALFDYSKVPPVIDYLRRSGLVPFASFPYFATKATAKTLYRQPMDVLKYYKPSVAGKTEEQKAQEKLYPKWMQPQNYLPLGKSTRMRDGKEETVDQFLDTSFIFPFDNDVSVSPAFTLAASLATNKNWLTGADIARKGQLPTDKAQEYFKYAAQQLLPSFAPYGYSAEKLAMAFKGEMDKQGRQYTPQEAVLHTVFGLKNVPINTDEMAKKAFQGMKRDIMDTRLTMRDIMRDKRLTADQKQQRIKEYQEHIKQLSQQAQVLQKAYKDAKGKSIE